MTELAHISEERYGLAVEGMSVGLWDWNVETNALYWSNKFKEMVGIDDDSFVPHYDEFANRLHQEDRESTLKALFNHLERRIPYDVEYRLKHNHGHYVWVHASGMAKWDSHGKPIRMVGSVSDISVRKSLEKERERLIEQLTQSNTELERFAYVASHDMQEPLRMITSFSEIIVKDYGDKLDNDGKQYLQLILDSGTRMRAMIEDLLEYSRLGNEESSFVHFDGTAALAAVIENLKGLMSERKAAITYDPLPQLYGNPIQFMRLMQNLITNAAKYQPPGNTPRIHIGANDESTHHWHISVQDNGLGVGEDFARQIFMPFRRLHAYSEIQGIGMGLAICKKIVENHLGTIWVTSHPGEGSIFHFTISKALNKVMARKELAYQE